MRWCHLISSPIHITKSILFYFIFLFFILNSTRLLKENNLGLQFTSKCHVLIFWVSSFSPSIKENQKMMKFLFVHIKAGFVYKPYSSRTKYLLNVLMSSTHICRSHTHCSDCQGNFKIKVCLTNINRYSCLIKVFIVDWYCGYWLISESMYGCRLISHHRTLIKFTSSYSKRKMLTANC